MLSLFLTYLLCPAHTHTLQRLDGIHYVIRVGHIIVVVTLKCITCQSQYIKVCTLKYNDLLYKGSFCSERHNSSCVTV